MHFNSRLCHVSYEAILTPESSSGGWWGSEDSSGNYSPGQMEIDDDITSVISYSTTGDEQDWETDDANDDGRRTPTQKDIQVSSDSSPLIDTPLNPADLAQLLYPKTPEQRGEAQALAAHLSSDKILTRSRYREFTQRERARVLTSTRHRPANFIPSSPSGPLTPREESQILEHLIITQRSSASSSAQSTSWSRGAEGMGEGGPQCVVSILSFLCLLGCYYPISPSSYTLMRHSLGCFHLLFALET